MQVNYGKKSFYKDKSCLAEKYACENFTKIIGKGNF